MFAESLTPRPELENSQDPERTCAPARDQLQWRAGCELIILPMLARKNPRGCDAADCGLARKARLIRVCPALCRKRDRYLGTALSDRSRSQGHRCAAWASAQNARGHQ